MQTGTCQGKIGSATGNRHTTLSPPDSNKSQNAPLRIDADRNKTKGAAASGCSGPSHFHSHNTLGSVRKTTGQSEEVGHKSTIGCSGAPPTSTASEKDGAGASRRILANSMRGDLRVNADQIKFDQVKFDSAKFVRQESSGSRAAACLWTANRMNSPRRAMLTRSSTESSRVQSITAKLCSVAEPVKQCGHASVTSSTCQAPVITSKQPPQLTASASATGDRPVVVVLTRNKRRDVGAVISSSDSIVQPPAGFRLLSPVSKVHESPSCDARHLSTVPSSTFAGHGLQAPEVYGKIHRKESGSRSTQEAESFRQICSSASYTLVFDRVQGPKSGENSVESKGASGHETQHCDTSCKAKTVTSEVQSVSRKTTVVANNCQGVSGEVELVASDEETVVTQPENATSEPEQARNAVDFPGRETDEDTVKLSEDKANVCDHSSSSLTCRSSAEHAKFQKTRNTDSTKSETASEVGPSTKVRFTKPTCVSETLAVDHFRSKLAEEKTVTYNLKRQLGALRKDLAKSRTDLLREGELRKRAEEWAEYLERELESYVRSRAEAEERYLNLLQVVRGIDHFTKQLLHKYVALHRQMETSFERPASNRPPDLLRSLLAQYSAADEEQAQSDPTAMTAESAEPKYKRPPSTSENDQPDLLSDDDYDFITRYLKASSSLSETTTDSEGLFPDADEFDAEANWSSNNFVSYRDVSRRFDETGRIEEQGKSTHVLEAENSFAENNGEHGACACGNKKLKTFDARLRRLSKFFDQVISICYKKPATYFSVLEDRSCCLADEMRSSVEERKREDFRSKRGRSCQNKDFTLQARSHGAGDTATRARVGVESGNGCQVQLPSDSADEANWKQEEEEKLEEYEDEEEEDVEVTNKDKKQVEKVDKSKLKTMSSESSDQVDAASPSVAAKAEEEKTTSRTESCDRQPDVETIDKGQEKEASRTDSDERVSPSGVPREYVNRLLREMCHYCDRYRPGDRAAGLKAFLRDTIEAEFLSKDADVVSLSRQVDK